MPTISLRLTDQELAELRTWAQDGKRSLQKEIIWRLFSAEAQGAAKTGPAINEPRVEMIFPDEELHAERTAEGSDTRYSERDERMKSDHEWLKRRAGKKR